ncbi:hypothetical protein ACPESL_07950 [Psychrobacter pocilloporae]|uniref:hypothetical protein n=1 Tax=Psychrobacter pocilloporae TaxID=1775882 RepID=UPI003C3039DF
MTKPIYNFDDAPIDAAYQFLAGDVQTQIDKTGDKVKRTFSGVAYHGGQIDDHWYWGNLVFDLDNLDLADGKVPMLVEHDRDQRCGFINSHNIGDAGLSIDGTLLSNEHGTTIANDADEGYPWQMSVSIKPTRVETVESGQVTVNGRTFNAPVTIFRQNTIREVSFCALGADRHTNAQVFNENQDHNKPKGNNVDLEQAKAKITELEASLSQKSASEQAAIDELAQFKQAKRDSDIEALAAKTGQDFSEDKLTALKSMDENSFSMFASMLPAKAEQGKGVPEHLFNEQATHGVTVNADGGVDDYENKFAEWSKA